MGNYGKTAEINVAGKVSKTPIKTDHFSREDEAQDYHNKNAASAEDVAAAVNALSETNPELFGGMTEAQVNAKVTAANNALKTSIESDTESKIAAASNTLRQSIEETAGTIPDKDDVDAWIANYLSTHDIGSGSGGTVTNEQISNIIDAYAKENGLVFYDENDSDNPTSGQVLSVSVDVLNGKTIMFIGDSICEGVGTSTQSETLSNYTSAKNTNSTPYSYWIAKNHPTATVINEGWGGYTIANKTGATNSICQKIDNGDFDKYKTTVDIIVVQGGINDVAANKLGYARGGYSINRSDAVYVERPKTTVFPAVEYVLEYFIKNFVGAKVYYMSTYNVPNYDQSMQNAMYNGVAEICNHLGVGYIDCFGNIPTATFPTGSKYYTQLHANTNVHKDYVCPVVDKALCYGTECGVKSRTYFGREVPMGISLYTGTTQFNVGDTFSCANWRINGITCEGRYITCTSNLSTSTNPYYDASEVDMSVAGTYPVYVTYHANGATVHTIVKVTVTGDAIEKTLTSITATKTKTSYTEGDTLSTSDITVTATYSDGSTQNVTSSATLNTDDIIMSQANTYYIGVSYTDGDITKSTQIAITVSVSGSGGDEPSGDWDSTATINGTWGTGDENSIFAETSTRYTANVAHNITFKGVCDHSGTITFQVWGSKANIDAIANEEFDVTMEEITPPGTGNSTMKVYTTSGSATDFPWTVKIKDFVVTVVE